jgi:hypothetical protein
MENETNASAVDSRAVELLDRCTAAMQRRGLLPLNTLVMAAECLFWASGLSLLPLDYPLGWAGCVMAGIYLNIAFARWRAAQGYWESRSKTLHLNAMAALEREQYWRWRLFFACVSAAWQIFLADAMCLTNCVAFIGLMYLRCCRYLGPGEFDRDRKAVLPAALQEG